MSARRQISIAQAEKLIAKSAITSREQMTPRIEAVNYLTPKRSMFLAFLDRQTDEALVLSLSFFATKAGMTTYGIWLDARQSQEAA